MVPTPVEISTARNALARNFRTEEEFRRTASASGFDERKVDEIVEQRLKMEKYLDFGSRTFVVIGPKEIT